MFRSRFVVIFLFLSVIFFVGCESNKETKIDEVEAKVDVTIKQLKKQTYPIWIDFSGKTKAYQEVEVVSRVSGELKHILFKAGYKVKKDQILFKIDDAHYKAVLSQKEATLLKDKATLNLAKATLNRYKPLVKKDLVPKEKLDELIANVEQLQALVNADYAVVKQAKLNVEYTEIRASIDGLIGKSNISEGNLISANSTNLTKIVKSDILYVNFSPSSDEVALIKKYRSQIKPLVQIKLDNDTNIKLNGEIDFIDNSTNKTTGTVNMRAILDNKDNAILPGTFVEIKLLLTDKIKVLALNPNNLGQNQLGSFVYVVDEANKLQTRQVNLRYSNDDLAIIKSGLKEGVRVVISNITKLRNNLLVNPKLSN